MYLRAYSGCISISDTLAIEIFFKISYPIILKTRKIRSAPFRAERILVL